MNQLTFSKVQQKSKQKKPAEALGFQKTDIIKAQEVFHNLYSLFIGTDASQLEINPLVKTDDGQIVCVDAKINIDDNANFRQEEIFKMRDESEEDPREVAASKFGLQYVGLDGNIGCMVNGAGLAMATMDIIKLSGGEPANFLDVGGGATKEQVTAALKIITADPKVKGILVNIFGGIMKCDIIANGILAAVKETKIEVPITVRLAGTNSKEGLKILDESGLNFVSAENLDDAASKAVKSLKK